jgi:hypothetical protein
MTVFPTKQILIRCEFLTEVEVKLTVYWATVPCCVVGLLL